MIRIGIFGYGNLGRGVEAAIRQNRDMELCAVFTRRDPSSVKINTEGVAVVGASDVDKYIGKIDVMIICGGSATDLPVITPELAGKFSVIDSFDTHANIPMHFASVDAAAKVGGNVALISCGWWCPLPGNMRDVALPFWISFRKAASAFWWQPGNLTIPWNTVSPPMPQNGSARVLPDAC